MGENDKKIPFTLHEIHENIMNANTRRIHFIKYEKNQNHALIRPSLYVLKFYITLKKQI